MSSFVINGYSWRIKFVEPNSEFLIDRTGNLRLATTDSNTFTIYLSNRLYGSMLHRVLIHEISHAVLWSYDLIIELHKMVRPEFWIESEEWLCNFVADYGMAIFSYARKALGNKAIIYIPEALERIVA